jgi:hypothetical protein
VAVTPELANCPERLVMADEYELAAAAEVNGDGEEREGSDGVSGSGGTGTGSSATYYLKSASVDLLVGPCGHPRFRV